MLAVTEITNEGDQRAVRESFRGRQPTVQSPAASLEESARLILLGHYSADVDAGAPGDHPDFGSIVEAATDRPTIASAAIFVRGTSGDLTIAAAAGIEGVALERLVSAVQDPMHPIARTLADQQSTFNVTPVAPGGPALRSHLPLLVERGGWWRAVGVLAVAHDSTLGESEQQVLTELAAQAAHLVTADRG